MTETTNYDNEDIRFCAELLLEVWGEGRSLTNQEHERLNELRKPDEPRLPTVLRLTGVELFTDVELTDQTTWAPMHDYYVEEAEKVLDKLPE